MKPKTRTKKELKKVSYYDLLFLDTSLTGLLIHKMPRDWCGTVLDFLNTDIVPEGKVTLVLTSGKLEKEVAWEIVYMCLEIFEEQVTIPTLAMGKIKRSIKKNIEISQNTYTEQLEVRRFIDNQLVYKPKDDTGRLLLELASGFDPHTSALNCMKFLIKNGLLTHVHAVDMIKLAIKRHNFI